MEYNRVNNITPTRIIKGNNTILNKIYGDSCLENR
ncbi:MAG: hypothetical protein IPO21_04860 [Bacteroidales bacterium]|nr:hypothetical protein [Bacteroidales bacterium]